MDEWKIKYRRYLNKSSESFCIKKHMCLLELFSCLDIVDFLEKGVVVICIKTRCFLRNKLVNEGKQTKFRSHSYATMSKFT